MRIVPEHGGEDDVTEDGELGSVLSDTGDGAACSKLHDVGPVRELVGRIGRDTRNLALGEVVVVENVDGASRTHSAMDAVGGIKAHAEVPGRPHREEREGATID